VRYEPDPDVAGPIPVPATTTRPGCGPAGPPGTGPGRAGGRRRGSSARPRRAPARSGGARRQAPGGAPRRPRRTARPALRAGRRAPRLRTRTHAQPAHVAAGLPPPRACRRGGGRVQGRRADPGARRPVRTDRRRPVRMALHGAAAGLTSCAEIVAMATISAHGGQGRAAVGEPWHCLYLRPEPHGHGRLRDGPVPATVASPRLPSLAAVPFPERLRVGVPSSAGPV